MGIARFRPKASRANWGANASSLAVPTWRNVIPATWWAERRLSARAARWPVYVEHTILELPQILINGGRRGYLLGIEPAALVDLLSATAVDCALKEG